MEPPAPACLDKVSRGDPCDPNRVADHMGGAHLSFWSARHQSPGFHVNTSKPPSSKIRTPSGDCGMSQVSNSDLALTVAASKSGATWEPRSSMACALSPGLILKNSNVNTIAPPASRKA